MEKLERISVLPKSNSSQFLLDLLQAVFPLTLPLTNALVKSPQDLHVTRLIYQFLMKPMETVADFIFSSVQYSCSVVSGSLLPHELQHGRPPCPSPTPRVYPNSCPMSRWCHPAISSSVIPCSSCLQSFPALGSSPVSQFFASGGQSIRVSAPASVFPMSIQDWFPLEWTCWNFLQSKGLSRIFFNTTVQKHQFFGI